MNSSIRHSSRQHRLASAFLAGALAILLPAQSIAGTCGDGIAGINYTAGNGGYSWAARTGGDAVGATAVGATKNFNWAWSPGGTAINGTVGITRTGAGSTYTTSEAHNATIVAAGFTASAYNNSTYSNSVGGVTGISTFVSEGETGRASNDVANGSSTSVLDFNFAAARHLRPIR